MSTHKNINKICVVVTVLAVVLTILFMNGKKLGLTSLYEEDAEAYEDSAYFTANDQKSDWDESSATFITLDGDECKISGNGAYFYDGNVVISGGGYYVISGTLDDGSIVVDAYDSSKVFIKLKDVDIYCSDDACLRIDQADKVFLTLADGTENSFESGEEYSDEALEDGTGGTIFAHDDLTINGTGSLTVTANYKHGIDANDDLMITGGYIAIFAPKDGIHVNDSIRIKDADIVIDAEDDGIVTAKEGGYIYMESGTLDIAGSDDGIHATGDVIVDGGEIDITAGDDGIHSDTNVTINYGNISIPQCYEGIEAITIDIAGGEIEIYPSDDGLNANGGSGDMFVMGGMQGGMNGQNQGMGGMQDGINGQNESMGDMQGSMNGQNEDVGDMQSGMSDQNGSIEASDDKSDTSSINPETESSDTNNSDTATENYDTEVSSNSRMENEKKVETETSDAVMEVPQDNRTENVENNNTEESSEEENSEEDNSEEETYIKISGGKLTIINETGQDADGIDSNGSIYISGGEIYVSLSGNGTNNAIDYGSENSGICEISGGTVIACGGSGMVEEISDTSTQCSILYNLSTAVEAGANVTLTDSDGEQLISYEVPCSFSSVVISTPEMKQNENYTLTMGDTTEEIETESIAGTYGEAVATMGGMGGMQGGGMQGGGMFDQNDSSDQNNSIDLNNTDTQDSSNNMNFGRKGERGGTPPNMSEDGDFTPPDMSGDGNFTSPDMSGDGNFTPPDMSEDGTSTSIDNSGNEDTSSYDNGVDENQNGNQDFQQGRNMNYQQSSENEVAEDDTTVYSSFKEVTDEEWLWLLSVAGVLVLGLMVAKLYKRW